MSDAEERVNVLKAAAWSSIGGGATNLAKTQKWYQAGYRLLWSDHTQMVVSPEPEEVEGEGEDGEEAAVEDRVPMPTDDEYLLVFKALKVGATKLSKKRKGDEPTEKELYDAIPEYKRNIATIARVMIIGGDVGDVIENAMGDVQDQLEREENKDNPNEERVDTLRERDQGLGEFFASYGNMHEAYANMEDALFAESHADFLAQWEEFGIPELDGWDPESWGLSGKVEKEIYDAARARDQEA